MHELMAATLEECVGEIAEIQSQARAGHASGRPRWPMIVLRSPKGWTGLRAWMACRRGIVPLAPGSARGLQDNPAHLQQLEEWLRSYRPWELFDDSGTVLAEISELAPEGERRMSANPHANGGV